MSGSKASGRHPVSSLKNQQAKLGLSGGQMGTDYWKTHPDSKRPAAPQPSCPKWLTGPARSEWAYVADDLAELGLLSKLSRAELRSFVMMYHLQRMAYEDVLKRGITIEIETNYGASVKRNPSVDGCARATAELMRILRRWLPVDKEPDAEADQTSALGHFLQRRAIS